MKRYGNKTMGGLGISTRPKTKFQKNMSRLGKALTGGIIGGLGGNYNDFRVRSNYRNERREYEEAKSAGELKEYREQQKREKEIAKILDLDKAVLERASRTRGSKSKASRDDPMLKASLSKISDDTRYTRTALLGISYQLRKIEQKLDNLPSGGSSSGGGPSIIGGWASKGKGLLGRIGGAARAAGGFISRNSVPIIAGATIAGLAARQGKAERADPEGAEDFRNSIKKPSRDANLYDDNGERALSPTEILRAEGIDKKDVKIKGQKIIVVSGPKAGTEIDVVEYNKSRRKKKSVGTIRSSGGPSQSSIVTPQAAQLYSQSSAERAATQVPSIPGIGVTPPSMGGGGAFIPRNSGALGGQVSQGIRQRNQGSAPRSGGGSTPSPSTASPAPSGQLAPGTFGAPAWAGGFNTGQALSTAKPSGSPSSSNMSREQRALLETIAAGEGGSLGYKAINYMRWGDAGKQAANLDNHPFAGTKGHTAAGRYQILASNWERYASKLGIKDFSPESQDKVAWAFAQDMYRQKTKRNLAEDIRNPQMHNQITETLRGTWHGIKGGDRLSSEYTRAGQTQLPNMITNPGQGRTGGGVSPLDPSKITDISNKATYARQGEKLENVQGLVFHHTAGRGNPEGVVNTLNQRGLGVQYVMDRDGKVYRTLPDGSRGAHILPSQLHGLNNGNTIGIEVIGKNNNDITPAQVRAGQEFHAYLKQKHPNLQVYGHGEVNPGHKEATEGMAIVNAIRANQQSGGNSITGGTLRGGNAPTPTQGGNISFANRSVANRAGNLNPDTQQALSRFNSFAPTNTVVTSTFRDRNHENERHKRKPGAHTEGRAIDVRTQGKSPQEIMATIQGLKKAGFNYLLLEGNPPHIHAEKRPGSDFNIQNLGAGNPHISLEAANAAAAQVPFNVQPSSQPAQMSQPTGLTPEQANRLVNPNLLPQRSIEQRSLGAYLGAEKPKLNPNSPFNPTPSVTGIGFGANPPLSSSFTQSPNQSINTLNSLDSATRARMAASQFDTGIASAPTHNDRMPMMVQQQLRQQNALLEQSIVAQRQAQAAPTPPSPYGNAPQTLSKPEEPQTHSAAKAGFKGLSYTNPDSAYVMPAGYAI